MATLIDRIAGAAATDPLSVEARQLQHAEDDGRFMASMKRRWDEADKAQRPQEKLWREALAFLEGIQYLYSALATPVWLNVQANNPSRVADNRLAVLVRRSHAQLTRPSFEPSVTPLTDMPDDFEAARIADSLCRTVYHRQQVPRAKRDLTWWVLACGTAWIETYWDPEAGTEREVEVQAQDEFGAPAFDTDPATGERTPRMETQTRHTGQVGYLVRSPFAVRRDPRFQEWELCRYAFVREIAAREDVLARYAESYQARTGEKLSDRLPKDQSLKATPWVPEAVGPADADFTGIQQPGPSLKDAIEVTRYYERPSQQHPNGRHGVYAGDVLLHRSDLETPLRAIPLVPFGYWTRPWQLEARSPVSQCLQLQRLYNYVLSRWYEHIKRWAAGYVLNPTTSGLSPDDFTNQPDILTHNPQGKPEFLFPPFGNLQGYLVFLQRIETSMEEQLAIPPIIRGQAPKGSHSKAAKALELMQEQAEAIQRPVIEDLGDAWVQVWRQEIGWMQIHYSDDTITEIVGADQRGIVRSFRQGTIPDDWQNRLLVTVDLGGSLPTSRTARMQTILELSKQELLFGRPGTPEHARMLRQALGFPAGYLEADTDLDRGIARVENPQLRAGEAVRVHAFDDDEAHIAEHLTYAKQLTVGGIDPNELNVLMAHVEAHRMSMQQKHHALGPEAAKVREAAQPVPGQERQPNAGQKAGQAPSPPA